MSLMAQNQKKKAEEFVRQAEAVMNKKAWFASGRERNMEDGAELLLQAANAYKVGGLNHEAGTTYDRVAALYRDKLNNAGEAAKSYQQAGTCFKKSNPVDTISAYQSAVSLLMDAGRLNQAAKLCKECAELYESEEVTMTPEGGAVKSTVVAAIEMYERSKELFDMEDAKSASQQCTLKIAELCSAALEPPDLIRSAKLYDELGRRCLDSNLLKYNAKAYFLQAIFCHLANSDSIGAQQAMSKYESLDYTFGDSREGKFCKTLIECVEGYDAEGFATACFEYDRISKLDPWKTTMLVQVKRSIQGDAGAGGGGDDDEDDVDLT